MGAAILAVSESFPRGVSSFVVFSSRDIFEGSRRMMMGGLKS